MSEYLDQRLRLTRCSIEVWQADVTYLISAEAGSSNSGFVDGNNLVRAGEVLAELEQEARLLHQLAEASTREEAEPIWELLDSIGALRGQAQNASRRMHRLTA